EGYQDRCRLHQRSIARSRMDEATAPGCHGGLRAHRPDFAEQPERGRAGRTAPGDCQTARLRRTGMAQHNQFVIRNDLSRSLTLNIEPEGAFFPLGKGEEVSVFDVFTTSPVTLILTNSERGDPILSIWPG